MARKPRGRRKPAETRTRAYREAEKQVEYHAVCLIGYEAPVPRYFGDNRGAWPVRVTTSKKPRDAAKRADLEQPLHDLVVLDFVQVETEEHARILKATLDELLLGSSNDNKALRHGWRDIEQDPALVWPVLLKEAIEKLTSAADDMRRATQFEVFSEEEKERRIKAKARGTRR